METMQIWCILLLSIGLCRATGTPTCDDVYEKVELAKAEIDKLPDGMITRSFERTKETIMSMTGLDVDDPQQVRQVVCDVMDAESVKELANAIGVPYPMVRRLYIEFSVQRETLNKVLEVYLPFLHLWKNFLKDHPDATYPFKDSSKIEDVVELLEEMKELSLDYDSTLAEDEWLSTYSGINATIKFECLEKLAYKMYVLEDYEEFYRATGIYVPPFAMFRLESVERTLVDTMIPLYEAVKLMNDAGRLDLPLN